MLYMKERERREIVWLKKRINFSVNLEKHFFPLLQLYTSLKIHSSVAKKLTLLNKQVKLKKAFSNIFENLITSLS